MRRERPELRLVLTGGGDFPSLPEGVDVRGQVPAAELVDLMQRASALVFPSLYEGFGLPPLEAMACGCPVASLRTLALCPRSSATPRGCSTRTTRVRSRTRCSTCSRRPSDVARRGLARAAQFSWDATARAHRRGLPRASLTEAPGARIAPAGQHRAGRIDPCGVRHSLREMRPDDDGSTQTA